MKKETVEHKSSKSNQQALTEGANKHQVAQKPEPGDISEGDERGVLDQVRDLLFGDQARDADQQMQAVEARLTTSIAQVRLEARDRIEVLSKEMLERMDKIEERLSAQEAELHSAIQNSLQRMEGIQAELSERLVKETKDLEERVTDGQQQTLAYVDRAVGALENAKADRDTLARLFSRMASRLEGNE